MLFFVSSASIMINYGVTQGSMGFFNKINWDGGKNLVKINKKLSPGGGDL